MKTKSLLIALFVAGMMLVQADAFADEMIQGVVTWVNNTTNSFRVTWVNPPSGIPESLTIFVPWDVKLKGINSLEDLHEGSHVQVETHKIIRGVRAGRSIEAESLTTF